MRLRGLSTRSWLGQEAGGGGTRERGGRRRGGREKQMRRGARVRHGGDGRRGGDESMWVRVGGGLSILQSCRLDILCFDGLAFIFTAVFLCRGGAVLKSSIFS